MQVEDRIYGSITITEPVLAELISSKPFQRLKHISQDGAPHFIQPVRTVSRYEHSIGVWYLSSRYKRPLTEQIAALLHDLPHTAFSHVIDFVMRDSKHEFHEKFMEQIIRNSEIPQILARHNIQLEAILDKEGFPLLDNDLPNLSVDRWDYFMRDGHTMGFLPQNLIDNFLNGVAVANTQFYFKDVRLAATFAILFCNFSRLIWLDPTSHGSFFLVAEAIKVGVTKGLISEDDFFLNDLELWEKLTATSEPEVVKYLERLQPGREFVYASEAEAEFFGPNKPRFVDPLVVHEGSYKRVSELVPSLAYFFSEFAQKYQQLGVNQL